MNRDKKLLIIFFPRFVLSTEYRFLIEFISLEVTCSRGSCDFPESDQSSNDFFFSHQNDLWLSVFVFSIRLSVCSSVLTWKILSSCVQILKWELETLGTNLLLKNSLEWNHFWWNFGLITRWALYYISLWMFKSHSKHSFGKT
jgi:hypothetical protein